MPRVVGTIQIVLSLVIIITLAVGCAGSSVKQEEQPKTQATDKSQKPKELTAEEQLRNLGLSEQEIQDYLKQRELAETTKTIESWEFKLNSISIRSTNIILNITVTSHYNTIKTYFSSITGEIGTRELVVVDQYRGIFVDRTDKPFYEGQYYPEDSKTGNLKFAVNPKSGKVELWLIPSTSGLLATYNQNKLFDLGEIK